MIRATALLALTLGTTVAAQAADATHANFDHPAVAVARMARTPVIDANTFLVQPPASVTWTTLAPEAKVVAVAAPATLK